MTVNGVPATNVMVVNPTTITAKTSAIAAGTTGDVVVSNSNGQTGRLWDAFLSDFADVPLANQYHADVVKIPRGHITAGCGGGNYCPTVIPAARVTRAQMAVFVLKAEYSSVAYTVPPVPQAGTGFADVLPSDPFVAWIVELAREGITAGCGGGNFCPNNPIKRQEMAPFLLKAKYGSTYSPPACSGVFSDVACPSQFAAWIERAAAEGIMPGGVPGGCTARKFCPINDVLRGPMANHLVVAFGL